MMSVPATVIARHKNKTVIQRNDGVGITNMIRTPIGVVKYGLAQPRLQYDDVDCYLVLTCCFHAPVIIVIHRSV